MPSPATNNTSLSASKPATPSHKPAKVFDYDAVERHAPNVSSKVAPHVEPLSIKVEDGPDGAVPGFLHLPTANYTSSQHGTAAILLSGAGGGVVGPSSIYLSIADKLASLPSSSAILTLRLDYRYPAQNKYCVPDVLAAMNYLEDKYNMKRFVLVGWSFGGAPVFTVPARDKRVVGCATVASQTAETGGIKKLAPRPVLLLHGTGDRTLSPSCSERLYAMYGNKGQRELKLFDGDDHALTRNSAEADRLITEFILKCAGLDLAALGGEVREILGKSLVPEEKKLQLMKKGGDLRRPENIE